MGASGKRGGVIARELGLGETALPRWVRQAKIDAGRGPTRALTTGEREELGQLRRENQRLRMELRDRGQCSGRKRIARLMRAQGLRARPRHR